MARKRKTKIQRKQHKPSGQAAPQSLKVIAETDFKRLEDSIRNAERDKNEAVSIIGGLVNAAVDKKNLDKRAFAIYRRLSKLSDLHLHTTLAHLDRYRAIGKLDERASQQGQLLSDQPEIGAGAEIVQFESHREEVAEFEPEMDVAGDAA
jgi:hypothetical protein